VRIPGVGKKTAERMVLELKDKLIGVEAAAKGASAAPIPETGFDALETDVFSALLNLGCSKPAAEEAIRKAKKQGAPQEFEPLFRTALALVR
jgi:Holliday junction DNA helicase RuvA